MNDAAEQKILKILDETKHNIQMMGQRLDDIDGVTKHARNASLEILSIMNLLKLDNEEKNASKEKRKKEDGKEKTIQHKIEG